MMKLNINRFYDFLILSLFIVFMMSIPWVDVYESIYSVPYEDRSVYLKYFLFEESVLDYVVFSGVKDYFIHEFLWHYLIGHLLRLNFEIEFIFYFISFFSLLSAAFFILRFGKPWMLLLLINPLLIDFYFSQLRSALAVSLLMYAYLAKDRFKIISLFLVFFAMMVHTASFLFVIFYLFLLFMNRIVLFFNLSKIYYFMALLIFGAIVSLALGPLREWILMLIGDRRAEYPDMQSSFLYSTFWIIFLFWMILNYKYLMDDVINAYVFIILSVVAFNTLHGGYSTRFLAAAFPLIVLSVFNFKGLWKISIVTLFFFYICAQWLFWLRFL